MHRSQRSVLVLCASPRDDGNSRLLATSLAEGARAAGHAADLVELGRVATAMLRDCRKCRLADGRCSIEDSYRELLFDRVIPADALVYATPLYWYGMAAVLKNFFDRLVCYISASYPCNNEVVTGLKNKRTALLIASEECYPGATSPLVAHIQEISRYLHHEFVGVTNGIGNTRGEVRWDPSDPVRQAYEMGERLFTAHCSDYDIDSVRPNAVWRPGRERPEDSAMTPYSDV